MLTLAAHDANRWWRCGASAFAADVDGKLPNRNMTAADEGIAAAWVAETVIDGTATLDGMLGQTHENGVEVDADMIRHVGGYLDIVMKADRVVSETSLSIKYDQVTIQGRIDALGLTGRSRRIWDLKYGFDPVEIHDNKQVVVYAILDWLNMSDEQKAYVETYTLAVYQPRAQHRDGPYRKWVISIAELQDHIWELNTVVRDLHEKRQVPNDFCKRCPLAAKCEGLTTSVYKIVSDVETRAYLDPTGQQLADELDMLDTYSKLLKARKTAVEAEAEARIKQQKFVPGYGILPTLGKSAWKHPPEVVQMMTGVDPYEKKVVTPAELVRRKADKKIVDQITYRPTVDHKLVKIKQSDIEKAFKS